MCGIVGVFDLRGKRTIEERLVVAMNDSQHHRGPDGEGFHFAPGVGLGHKRLAIIDLKGGKQPLYNEDHTVVVTYNGEIYNFPGLIRELETLGHRFRTRCDTEVIVHAWEQWGKACLERFRGMFAFALWDANSETLFIARDRLGIKPLYYATTGDGHLIFASELKALQTHPGLDRSIDNEAVEDYFTFGYVPDPRTIFNNCFKLPPGHYLEVTGRAPCPQPIRYWDLPFVQHSPQASESEIAEELIRNLDEAVQLRLISDVSLGAFLSGGVDSSAVVAMMSRHSVDPVRTCSISFGDPAFNESRFAAKVASRFSTRHSVEQVDQNDYSLLPKLSGIYDEPFADSSAIPTYRVCELARRNVTVALSGDGGDENLAGYQRYRWFNLEEKFRKHFPPKLRAALFGTAGRFYPKADWAPRFLRAKSTLQAIARDRYEGYLHSVSVLNAQQRRMIFSDGFMQRLQGYSAMEVFRHHLGSCPTDDPLQQIQYLDFKTYLPGDILTKVDRASMAHGLEVRVPILDHHLVEWISGLPTDLKLNGREGKYIFKKALEPHLPQDVLYREKMGFAVPLAGWFRDDLKDSVETSILSQRMLDTGIFEPSALRHLLRQHQSGAEDRSAALWSLLMFDAFLERQSA